MNILIVEDDPPICEVLEYALKAGGHSVETTHRGRVAIEIARRSPPGLIVLDVGLPDIDGFEVCRTIRRFCDVPVIFLTSRSDEINTVVGLEIGGDDYIVKPFSTRELLARIKAIQRRDRRAEAAPENVIEYGPIEIDPEKFRVPLQRR